MLTLSKPPPEKGRTLAPQGHPDWPVRATDLLAEVDRLLRAGREREAVCAIGLSYLPCPWTANALAVCHLRLGDIARAEHILRHIALDGTGRTRPDVPTVFKTNLATALLISGDTAGCLRTLDEIGDDDDPAVRRLRAAAARWAPPLTAWARFARRLGIRPARPPVPDGPVGELSPTALG